MSYSDVWNLSHLRLPVSLPCIPSAHPSYYTSYFVSWYNANSVLSTRASHRVFFPTSFPIFQADNICFLDLLERALYRFRKVESEVNGSSSKIECRKNEVRLPWDVGQCWRDCPGKRKVERPVNDHCEWEAFPRTRMGKSCPQDQAIVMANEQTNKYKQTMVPLVTVLWPLVTQMDDLSTVSTVGVLSLTKERKKPMRMEWNQ